MAVSLGGQDGVNLGDNFGLSPACPAGQRSLVGAAGRSSIHLASSSKEFFVAEIAAPAVAPADPHGVDRGGFLRRFVFDGCVLVTLTLLCAYLAVLPSAQSPQTAEVTQWRPYLFSINVAGISILFLALAALVRYVIFRVLLDHGDHI